MSRPLAALVSGLLLLAASHAPALAQKGSRQVSPPMAPAYGPPPDAVPGPAAGQPSAQPKEAAPGQSAATPASPELRRQVSDARVLSATATCFYAAHIDRDEARRLCAQQARGRLLDAAAAQFVANPSVIRAGLSAADTRAFADSLLAVSVADEEVRPVADGLAVRLTLRAETNPDVLEQRLSAFLHDPALRTAALAETAARDRQAAEARMAAVPFGADREFRAREMEQAMGRDAAFAERRLVPGMSVAQVKELLGEPAALKQAVIGPESYLCANYGRVWVVYRDGVLSCLRSRLDYVRRYDTDCHCAGNYATILKND